MPDPKDPKKPPPRRDDTPIHGTPLHEPIETIAHRTRTTATDAREAVNTLTTMRDELRAHVARDEAELKRIGEHVTKIDEHVGNLRETTAGMEGKLDLLLEDRALAKEAEVNRQKLEAEAAAHADKLAAEAAAAKTKLAEEAAAVETKIKLEDAADKKKNRRAKRLKIWSIIGGAVAALTTLATTMATKC